MNRSRVRSRGPGRHPYTNYNPSGGIVDIDGNIYTSRIIGTQQWLVENLRTTKYADGTAIPNVTLDASWAALATGAYCWYDNDISHKTPYGALYNWHGVDNIHKLAYFERKGVQEVDWRVASKIDYDTLVAYLGGSTVAGGKMKEAGYIHWTPNNANGSNSSGFTALPGGIRAVGFGGFVQMNTNAYFWTTTEYTASTAYDIDLSGVNGETVLSATQKHFGLSVRCMRDVT